MVLVDLDYENLLKRVSLYKESTDYENYNKYVLDCKWV